MPIKKAGDEGNYIIETEDADATIDEDSDFALQDDKKTVVITLTEDAAQQEVIDLTIKGIESESGEARRDSPLKALSCLITPFLRLYLPRLLASTIKVTFSEPIMVPYLDEEIDKDEDNDDFFSIDGGDYLIEKIEKLGNDTELNVTLYSALEETVEIEAKPAIKDYAGFGIPKKTLFLMLWKTKTVLW